MLPSKLWEGEGDNHRPAFLAHLLQSEVWSVTPCALFPLPLWHGTSECCLLEHNSSGLSHSVNILSPVVKSTSSAISLPKDKKKEKPISRINKNKRTPDGLFTPTSLKQIPKLPVFSSQIFFSLKCLDWTISPFWVLPYLPNFPWWTHSNMVIFRGDLVFQGLFSVSFLFLTLQMCLASFACHVLCLQ